MELAPPGLELVRGRDQAAYVKCDHCARRRSSTFLKSKPLYLEFVKGVWRRLIPFARLVHALRHVVAPVHGIVHAPTVRWFLGGCLRRESPCRPDQTGQPSVLKSNKAGFEDPPPNLSSAGNALQSRTGPCLAYPCLACHARHRPARPGLAMPRPRLQCRAMPRQTETSLSEPAGPCPSKHSFAYPCLPGRTEPNRTKPGRAVPCLPRCAAPICAKPCPSTPALPVRAGPCPALTCRACQALPGRA